VDYADLGTMYFHDNNWGRALSVVLTLPAVPSLWLHARGNNLDLGSVGALYADYEFKDSTYVFGNGN